MLETIRYNVRIKYHEMKRQTWIKVLKMSSFVRGIMCYQDLIMTFTRETDEIVSD